MYKIKFKEFIYHNYILEKYLKIYQGDFSQYHLQIEFITYQFIGTYYWLGATDSVSENTWRWRSDNALMSIGSSIVESGVNWTSGQPGVSGFYNYLLWNSGTTKVSAGWNGNNYRFICEQRCIPIL